MKEAHAEQPIVLGGVRTYKEFGDWKGNDGNERLHMKFSMGRMMGIL